MAKPELHLTSIPQELENAAKGRLLEITHSLRAENRSLTFPNVINEAIELDTINRRFDKCHFLFSYPPNEQLFYEFIKQYAKEFNINLYEEELIKHLDVEPGWFTNHVFKEMLGFWLITHLPNTWNKIKSAPLKSVFGRLDECERGLVGALLINEDLSVMKFTLSEFETEIARHLGEKGLAPQVYEATEDIIVEEFIPDPRITDYKDNRGFVETKVQDILTALHKEGVVYNNRIMDHVLINPQTMKPRIIDLERVYWGNDFHIDWQNYQRELKQMYPFS